MTSRLRWWWREHLAITVGTHAEHSSILNILAATVSNIQYLDNGQCLVQVSVEGQQLLARISQFSCESLGLQPGQSVFLQIKALAIVG